MAGVRCNVGFDEGNSRRAARLSLLAILLTKLRLIIARARTGPAIRARTHPFAGVVLPGAIDQTSIGALGDTPQALLRRTGVSRRSCKQHCNQPYRDKSHTPAPAS